MNARLRLFVWLVLTVLLGVASAKAQVEETDNPHSQLEMGSYAAGGLRQFLKGKIGDAG